MRIKIRIIILVLLYFISYEYSNSQNLVQNWSFEDTIPCISNPNLGAPETAPPWFTANQSPDYFSLNYCGGGAIGFGYQTPKTGNALVGFSTYLPPLVNDGRECFEQPLLDTLKAGHKYCVNFFVSLAEQSRMASDGITALFTSFQVDDAFINSFVAVPQIQNVSGNIISDTVNWVLISGDLIAQGGERYITIGNLKDDANTLVDTLQWGVYDVAYYYIDDISVIDCTVGINEINGVLTAGVYPNPAKDKINISFNAKGVKVKSMEILNALSSLVIKKEVNKRTDDKIILDVGSLTSGVYIIKVFTEEKILYAKFVKE